MNIVDIPFRLISLEQQCCVPFHRMGLELNDEECLLDSEKSMELAYQKGFIKFTEGTRTLFQLGEDVELICFQYYDIPMLDGGRPYFFSMVPIIDQTQQQTNFYWAGIESSFPPIIPCYSMTLSKEENIFEAMGSVTKMLELEKKDFIRIDKSESVLSERIFFLKKKVIYGVLHFGEYLCFTISPPIDKKIALERLE
ncbi:hypothetical protein HB825_01480 [Listeria booriae]|uniref:hypothetical protein n=1 Tax=Listeria booriae TaxID=1552123 RepID=UPI00164CF7EB|nr:hypothetical protein [Listeria booriae]MBC6133506.1 hypothetical protein [Listeria booriae]